MTQRTSQGHSDNAQGQLASVKATGSQDSEYPSRSNGLKAYQANILHLQRTVGNAAVQRMLRAPKTIQRIGPTGSELGIYDAPSTEAPESEPSQAGGPGNEEKYTLEQVSHMIQPEIELWHPSVGINFGNMHASYVAKVRTG